MLMYARDMKAIECSSYGETSNNEVLMPSHAGCLITYTFANLTSED